MVMRSGSEAVKGVCVCGGGGGEEGLKTDPCTPSIDSQVSRDIPEYTHCTSVWGGG